LDFNKLTLKSQEAVAAAQELARRMGNPELYPEHLVVALLDQELPRELVPDPDSFRAEAEAALRAKPSTQGAAQLIFESQDDFDAREVEAEFSGQPLDQAQPLQVGLRVEARVSARPVRADETLVLVDPQRLRMHADELGGDRDHVARAVVHQPSSSVRAGPHTRSTTASPAS